MSDHQQDQDAGAPAAQAGDDVHMTDAAPSTEVPTITEPQPTTAPQPDSQPPPQQPTDTAVATPTDSPALTPSKSSTSRGGASATADQQNATGSRAQSLHPESASSMPSKPVAHGAPVRQYLNSRVTPALLEGMKMVGKEQPSDPLRVLGEFLIQKSKELDGSKELEGKA